MKIFSELKLPQKNEHDNDWGFFVEVDVVNESTPLQKETYYKPRYYVLYKQRQRYQEQRHQEQRHQEQHKQIMSTIPEDNPLEIKQKYENVIVIKISFYVLISIFIFFMLSIHF